MISGSALWRRLEVVEKSARAHYLRRELGWYREADAFVPWGMKVFLFGDWRLEIG